MGAPKSNKFWMKRAKHGRDAIFDDPEIMIEAAYDYFYWCESNPLIEIQYLQVNKKLRKVSLPKMRPFTIEGVAHWMDVNRNYLSDFYDRCNERIGSDKEKPTDKDFTRIIMRIREIIYRQKFEGAASGFLNATIIARDLGLKDRSDVTTDDKEINISMPTKEQIKQINDELEDEC